MSAHSIPPTALLAAFVSTATPAWLAASRRRGTPFIATGLLTLQATLHVTFGAGHHHHTAAPAPAPAHAHTHAGMAETTASDGASTLAAIGLGGASAGMVAVHLLAAAVCALWLARGEAAFFRVARAIGALAFTPLRLLLAVVRLPDAPRPPRGAPTRTARRHHGVVLAHSLSRRGPPAPAVPRATVPGATLV
ncbi:hypothetical protein [Streptomyces sp. NPDC006368]|uniref:hypothetical protein n=1 Tax=Streptomyces sp. NPDC006368 TaxID=3156760 RepID=UPI0033A78CB3